MYLKRLLSLTLSLLVASGALAQDAPTYRQPSDDIVQLLDAPPPPSLSASPDGRFAVLMERPAMPSIEDLARPMLRLGGLRISPHTNSTFLTRGINRLVLKDLDTLQETEVAIPEDASLVHTSWSPDGSLFIFSNREADGLSLHGLDPASGEVRQLLPANVNGTFGRVFAWTPGGDLIVKTVPEGRGGEPEPPAVPSGPAIQETAGVTSPVRTFQDLLQTSYDEELLDYYFAAQLVRLDPRTGEAVSLGEPGIFANVDVSPDGDRLLVSRIVRPYSYMVPIWSFAQEVEVWNRDAEVISRVASLPVAENVPIGGVRTGPRNIAWDPHADARLVYVEALDEGDPRAEVAFRDAVFALEAPFEQPRELLKTEYRFARIEWTEDGATAFVSDFDRPSRHTRTFAYEWSNTDAEPRVVIDRLAEDRYADPGTFVRRTLPAGGSVVMQSADGRYAWLTGSGASPEGERPFLRRLDLQTFETEELFRSEDPNYESVMELLDAEAVRFVTRRESAEEPPNFYLYDREAGSVTPLTDVPDPQPVFREVERRLVTYSREDGVQLSATLYLPPDYQEGERRPAVIWAYPREFATAGAAGQVTGSPNRFTRVAGASHLFLLMEGYVVLDGAAMPILGGEEANDTFVEQLVANAEAAIGLLDSLGVADPGRVGVGGHSYGAFMTANLLAYSDLFRAGIARSGAYNRTLTPFGFQNERRSYWEAPEVYLTMSPFMHADRIDTPVLLIHGAEDNNSGTFPIQSERLYHALMGHGKTARLVMLPLESHGYVARESVLHTIYEQIEWMNRFVRSADGPLSAN